MKLLNCSLLIALTLMLSCSTVEESNKDYTLKMRIVNATGNDLNIDLLALNEELDDLEYEWLDFYITEVVDVDEANFTVDSIMSFLDQNRRNDLIESYTEDSIITLLALPDNDRTFNGPFDVPLNARTPVPWLQPKRVYEGDPFYRISFITESMINEATTIAHEIGGHLCLNVYSHPKEPFWYQDKLDTLFNIHTEEDIAFNILGYGYCRKQWTKEQSDSSRNYMLNNRLNLLTENIFN